MSCRAALIVAVGALVACGETPLEVITSVSGGNGGAGGRDAGIPDGAPEAGGLCEPSFGFLPGRYRVRQANSLRCLRAGDPTLLMGALGYLAAMDENCGDDDPDLLWDVIPAAPGRFEFRNVGVGMNLDIRYAGTANGTPAVLYPSTTLRNQQFFVQTLAPARFALQAAHASLQCFAERLPQPEIWTCDAEDPSQAWQLVPESCDQ